MEKRSHSVGWRRKSKNRLILFTCITNFIVQNKEFEWYVDDDENRFVRDGKLYIRPTLTVDKIGAHNLENGYISLAGCTDADEQNCHQQATPDRIIKPIRSARLNTAGSFSFKFGRVEVIARIPTGDWLWPGKHR